MIDIYEPPINRTEDIMCNCQNCTSEGLYEATHGFVPANCKYANVKRTDDPVTSYDSEAHTFDNIV